MAEPFRRPCVGVMRQGCQGGGVRATCGLCPMGGWWVEAGLLPGVRHWFFRFRIRLASGQCLAASVCRTVRWVGMLYCWLVHLPARFPLSGWACRSWWRYCPLWWSPHFFRWRPPWAPRVVAGLAVRAVWLRRLSVGPPLGRGLPTRGGGPGRLPRPAHRGVSAGTVACAGSGSGPGLGLGAGRLGDDGSVGSTAGPAGGAWCRRDAGSASAGACRWCSGAVALGVARAWGLGLSVGLWVWGCTVPEGRVMVVSVGAAIRVCLGGPSGGAYAGPAFGRSGVPWRGRGSGWACFAAAQLAAGWRPRVDAPGGVWGFQAGLPVVPGAGPMCGCAVPRGCSGRVPTAAVFVGLRTAPLPAGDARCHWMPVAAC